ncbi:8-oxo-dGTP diphosphatase [Roseovarius albus]|uniref:8-oxo-dGTP diphosphatase n=1 Tax=Roseovarius albus TaxID=1247867 RepID=A0A1X6YQ19_9RHOB|nr:NUDIX domain-containing protein [Roseovarius albus]SLN27511.1 8-oxo-dGTP diphosphatase [Roseovarius albus]
MPEIPIRAFMVSLVALRRTAARVEVLLLKRNETLVGEWCQIAGSIEEGETAWQAAVRELREETGLEAQALYSADICEQFYETDRNAITMAPVFVAFIDEGDAVVLNQEHSESRWVPFDKARDMVPFAGHRNVLRHVEEEFIVREAHPHLLIQKN